MDVDEVGPSLRYGTVKPKVVATEQRQDTRPAEDAVSRPSDLVAALARMVSA
jgi:hypothetical protein